LVPVALIVVALPSSGAAQSASQAAWNGWAQCVINTQGPGYSNQQTQTWNTTGGAPTAQGAFRMHPATWSVSGAGSLQRTQGSQSLDAQWMTSVPSASGTISVLVRASDGRRLIRAGHAQLRQPGGVTGTQTQTVSGKASTMAIAAEAFEWAFPAIEDASSSSRIQGSATSDVAGSFGYMQPAGARTTASCSWDFAQGAAPSPVPQVIAMTPPGSSAPGATPTAAPGGGAGVGSGGTSGSPTNPPVGGSAPPNSGAPSGSAPPAPTNVTLDPWPMIATLYWDASPNAKRFRIWRGEPGKAPVIVGSSPINGARVPGEPTMVEGIFANKFWCRDTVLDPRVTYSYTVTAYNANGDSASAPATPYLSPPLANPTGFTATYDAAAGDIRFAWQAANAAVGYELTGPGFPPGGPRMIYPSGYVRTAPAGTLTYKLTAIYARGFADYTTSSVVTVTVPAGAGSGGSSGSSTTGMGSSGAASGTTSSGGARPPLTMAPGTTTGAALGGGPPAGLSAASTTPVNPSGFAATQVLEDGVELTWNAVSGAAYYLLQGAGLPSSGVRVDSTRQVIRGVPEGAQSWTVGSFYTPGPISTSASQFTSTTLPVNRVCRNQLSVADIVAGPGAPSPLGSSPTLDTVPGMINRTAIMWPRVPGAVAYLVDRKPLAGGPYAWIPVGSNCAGSGAQNSPVVLTGSTPVSPLPANHAGILEDGQPPLVGVTSVYRVRAYDAGGRMSWSSIQLTKPPYAGIQLDSLQASGGTLTLRLQVTNAPRPPASVTIQTSFGKSQSVPSFGAAFSRLLVFNAVPPGPQTYTAIADWTIPWNGVARSVVGVGNKTIDLSP
jgi:hypothetical protein